MEILPLIATLGGFEFIRYVVNAILYRRTNKKQKEIAAAKEQISLIGLDNETDRKQIHWLEERLRQRDKRIDTLYEQLRQEQKECFILQQRLHKSILMNRVNELKRCDTIGCTQREPPSLN